MLCALILYISSGTYNITLTPNDRYFEKLIHGRFIFTLREKFLLEICLEEVAEKMYILMPHLRYKPGLTSNKPTRIAELPIVVIIKEKYALFFLLFL